MLIFVKKNTKDKLEVIKSKLLDCGFTINIICKNKRKPYASDNYFTLDLPEEVLKSKKKCRMFLLWIYVLLRLF